jgi:hypothetical protein
MTDTGLPGSSGPSHAAPAPPATPERTGWAGWIVFAGIIMILVGVFQALQGFVALFDRGYYVVGPEGLLVNVDYTGWGIVHLVLGLLIIAAGFGVMTGNTAARTLGVVLAVLSAIVNMAFVAAYPVWSIVIITIDVLVIWALTVHGHEMRD